MSENEVKITQEKWNMVLDIKDLINKHNRALKKMAGVINNQAKKIQELEAKILQNNTNVNFNDIFKEKS